MLILEDWIEDMDSAEILEASNDAIDSSGIEGATDSVEIDGGAMDSAEIDEGAMDSEEIDGGGGGGGDGEERLSDTSTKSWSSSEISRGTGSE